MATVVSAKDKSAVPFLPIFPIKILAGIEIAKNQIKTIIGIKLAIVEEREKSRGFFLRNEIIKKPASTIFNIFTDMDGKILACTWIRGTPAYLAEQRAKAAQDADATRPAP